MHPFEQEFITVMALNPANFQTRKDYLEAVVTKVGEVSDADWARLSKDAQVWANGAMTAFNAHIDISDYAPAAAQEEVIQRRPRTRAPVETAPEPAAPAATPRTRRTPAATAPAEAAPAAPRRTRRTAAAPAEQAPAAGRVAAAGSDGDGRRPGAQVLIKRMLMDNPEVAYDTLESELNRQGYQTSKLTINTVSADFRASLRLLHEKGLLTRDFASRVAPLNQRRAAAA